MSQSNSKQRIDYIDLLRAIGVLAMIMGHVKFGNVFSKWIHFFHMPMFFIISGYFYHEQSFRTMVKKRVKTLLVPYLIFGILHCVISFIIDGQVNVHAFYLLFWENTAEGGVPIAGALWFLSAMMITEVLSWCLQQLKFSVLGEEIIAAMIVALAGMAFATYLPFRLPWAIDAGMVGVGLYQIGKTIKEKWSKLLEQKFVCSIVGIVLFTILGLVCPYINLRTGKYGIWPMFWINAVGMTVSLLIFSKCFCQWIEKEGILVNTIAWLKGIGRESIVYLCLNQLAILVASAFLDLFLPSSSVALLVVKKLLILFVALALLYPAQILLTQTKVKAFLGR